MESNSVIEFVNSLKYSNEIGKKKKIRMTKFDFSSNPNDQNYI